MRGSWVESEAARTQAWTHRGGQHCRWHLTCYVAMLATKICVIILGDILVLQSLQYEHQLKLHSCVEVLTGQWHSV